MFSTNLEVFLVWSCIIGLMSIESLHLNYQKADKNYFCSTKIGINMLDIIYTLYINIAVHVFTLSHLYFSPTCLDLQEYQKVIDMISLICFIRIFSIITPWIWKKSKLTIRNLLYWFSIFFKNYFYAVSYFQTTKQPNLLEDVLVLYKTTF